MKNEETILKKLETALTDYQSESQNLTQSQAAKKTAHIQALRKELSDYFSEGAKACPDCGSDHLHGMRKSVIVQLPNTRANGVEVGCLNCPLRSQGLTKESAVEYWNSGKYGTFLEINGVS